MAFSNATDERLDRNRIEPRMKMKQVIAVTLVVLAEAPLHTESVVRALYSQIVRPAIRNLFSIRTYVNAFYLDGGGEGFIKINLSTIRNIVAYLQYCK